MLPEKWKSIFLQSLCCSLLIFFTGCASIQELPVPIIEAGQGSIQFAIAKQELASASLRSLSTAVPAVVDISIQDDIQGNYVAGFENKQLTISNFEGTYYTDSITLPVGDYFLTHFVVKDENNNVLYVTPIEGSKRAHLVNNPLPIAIICEKDTVNTVAIEVVRPEGGTLEDFGYVGFVFSIIESFSFKLSAYIFDFDPPKFFEVVTANIQVMSGEKEIYSGLLEATTNTVYVTEEDEDYTLIITKDGYEDKTKTYTNEQLKNYQNRSLLIKLKED
jgi:hypothetical protein